MFTQFVQFKVNDCGKRISIGWQTKKPHTTRWIYKKYNVHDTQ